MAGLVHIFATDHVFSDEQIARALDRTRAFLTKIDVAKIDALRVELGLRPEQLSIVIDVYVAALASETVLVEAPDTRASREVLPMSCPEPIRPGQIVRIKGVAENVGFRPERIFISGATDPLHAAAFNIMDIQVDGKTQFAQEGEIPGDMFACSAIDSFVSFDTVHKGSEFALVVKYIGDNPNGASFFGSVVGTAVVSPDDDEEKPESD